MQFEGTMFMCKITHDLKKRIIRQAESKTMSMSAIVRDAIFQYLDREETEKQKELSENYCPHLDYNKEKAK